MQLKDSTLNVCIFLFSFVLSFLQCNYWNWSPRTDESLISTELTLPNDFKYQYLHVFLPVLFLVMMSHDRAKKSQRLVTSKRLLWIAVWCTSHVAIANLRQERHARNAWHEIRRLPPTRVQGDYSTFEHHHVRTNRETGEHYTLSYKLRRHRSLYVNLDDTSFNVQQVFCTEDALLLVVASEMALEAQLKLWTYPDSTLGRLVYGGERWGCGVSNSTPTGSPLFRSMTGPAFFNATNKTFLIPTLEASPFAFFGSGHMHYFSNESTGPETDYEEGISEDYNESTRSETDYEEGISEDSRRKLENAVASADVDHPGQGAKNRASGTCSRFDATFGCKTCWSCATSCEAEEASCRSVAGCKWILGSAYGGTCSGDYGKFPEGGGQWGYGAGIEFNYNYDKGKQTAVAPRTTFAETSDYSIYCDTCYIYLQAGVGFEFQTEAFNIYPSYLVHEDVGGRHGNLQFRREYGSQALSQS
jgi:hypothetical protein